METRIFIATQGKNEIGSRLYEKLKKSGVKVRLDEGIQQLSDNEIEEKISTCSYFIPIIDRRLDEAHLLKLINWAIEYRKPIIPITSKGFSFPASIKKLNSCPNIESNGNDFPEVFRKLNSMIPDLNLTTQKTITSLHTPEVLENSTTPRVSVNSIDPYYKNQNKNIEIGLSIIEKFRWPLLLLILALLALGSLYSPEQNQTVIIYDPPTKESVEPIEKHSEKKHSVNFSSSFGTNSINVQQAIVSGNGGVVQQQMTTQAVNVNGNSQVYQYSVQQMGNDDYDYDRDYDYNHHYDW